MGILLSEMEGAHTDLEPDGTAGLFQATTDISPARGFSGTRPDGDSDAGSASRPQEPSRRDQSRRRRGLGATPGPGKKDEH